MVDRQEDKNPPDGRYGWVIVVSIILINVSLLTLINSFGIIFHDEFKAMDISSVETALLLHLQSFLYCGFGFFSSPMLKKLGYRSVAFLGSSLMCSGIFLTSFASSYGFLIFSVSVLTGVGQGIVMPATYLATYTYFKKRLTIAISLTVTGASLSNVVMPKLCDKLMSSFGRKYTVLALSGVSLVSFVGCALLKPLKQKESNGIDELKQDEKPLKIEEKTYNEDVHDALVINNNVYNETTIPTKSTTFFGTIKTKIYDMFDLQLIRNQKLMVVIFGLGISFACETNLIFMIQFILRELCNFNRSDVATAVSIQFVADIVGRLLVPFVAHSIEVPPKVMYGGALLFATLARTILSIWSGSHFTVYLACAMIGVTKGVRAVFQSVIIPKYVPLEKLPTANGLNMLLSGLLSLKLGIALGYIHDLTDSYVYSLTTGSVISCVCVVMWAIPAIFRKKTTGEQRRISSQIRESI